MDVSWTIKSAEHQELILSNCGAGEDSWESFGQRRSNQSILKEINSEYSLEGLMLKLKLQSFGHLTQRADSLEKTLMLGKTEGRRHGWRRGWDGWMTSPTQWTWVWTNSEGTNSVCEGQWSLACCSPWGRRVRHDLAIEQQQQQMVSLLSVWNSSDISS